MRNRNVLCKYPALFWMTISHCILTLGAWPGWLITSLALQGGRHNLWWQMEEVTQVLDALIGEVPVVVAPGELLVDVATRLERLQGLDNVQVGAVDLRVLGKVEVLLGHHDTLTEEVLVDRHTIYLWDQHPTTGKMVKSLRGVGPIYQFLC